MPIIKPRLRLRPSRRGLSAFAPKSATVDRLSELSKIPHNPGNLRGYHYVPKGLKGPAPLVVVLHGCTQNAAVYDHGSGWSTLADRHGFILLFPEQQRANNPMLCFNWFSPNHSQRGMGEAASIRSMIAVMAKAHSIDPSRIFVTGLSAGGAMASVMLATYPEIFAGGAILAGIAYGCANSASGAFDCMGGRSTDDAADLARHVRRASPHKGPWPRVQVWQGSADHTVVPSNAEAIITQYAELHGIDAKQYRSDEVEGHRRRAWIGPEGTALIEQYMIDGMAHGVPLDAGGADSIGEAGAHMLDVGVDSTARIAAFFGIAPEVKKPAGKPRARKAPRQGPAAGPQGVIDKALRAAGLIR